MAHNHRYTLTLECGHDKAVEVYETEGDAPPQRRSRIHCDICNRDVRINAVYDGGSDDEFIETPDDVEDQRQSIDWPW